MTPEQESELLDLLPRLRELVSGSDSTLHYHSLDRYNAPILGTPTVTTDTTAAVGDLLFVDTTTAAVVVLCPQNPTDGDYFTFVDVAGTFSTSNCIIDPGPAEQIMRQGVGNRMVCRTDNFFTTMAYNSTYGWIMA